MMLNFGNRAVHGIGLPGLIDYPIRITSADDERITFSRTEEFSHTISSMAKLGEMRQSQNAERCRGSATRKSLPPGPPKPIPAATYPSFVETSTSTRHSTQDPNMDAWALEGRLYVAAQQIKIERQRALIKELDIQDGDSQLILRHKETLREMMKNLDVLLGQLRLVIDLGGGIGAFH